MNLQESVSNLITELSKAKEVIIKRDLQIDKLELELEKARQDIKQLKQ